MRRVLINDIIIKDRRNQATSVRNIQDMPRTLAAPMALGMMISMANNKSGRATIRAIRSPQYAAETARQLLIRNQIHL